jgi:DNA invertase Pin-like site-specific DNA recombinase
MIILSIYIRVSTEDQAREGYSLDVQREYLESFAKNAGYEKNRTRMTLIRRIIAVC